MLQKMSYAPSKVREVKLRKVVLVDLEGVEILVLEIAAASALALTIAADEKPSGKDDRRAEEPRYYVLDDRAEQVIHRQQLPLIM